MKERIDMEKDSLTDLTLSGIGLATGGVYRHVKMDGVGKVAGDLEAESVSFNGVCTVYGGVSARNFELEGKLKVEGKLNADRSRINGKIDVGGPVGGESLALKGSLKTKGDCEVETFAAEGAFDIQGLLNAGTIEIVLRARGEAREIGGDKIVVRRIARSAWSKFVSIWSDNLVPELHADVIEGDDLDLTHTIASVVRGNRVTIGPGCRIGRVEYRSELKVHPSSKVKEEAKTGG